jgi:hypothetical protein
MENLNTVPGTAMPRNLITHAMISLFLVLPFIILELINRRNFSTDFPLPLFGMMWLLTFSFILLLIPVARSLRKKHLTNPLGLAAKVVLLAVIASIWVRLVVDQLPCFLGVPNCD